MISVLIASMGRPFLLSTLDSIAKARVPKGETVEVIIADDTRDGAVVRLIAGWNTGLPICVLPVGAGNVSYARNACLAAAAGDWLIFVDDDETVEPDWLEGHLSAARDFAADAVFGPVFPRYPEGTPAWFVAADPLFQDWKWDEDGRQHPNGRTGNTLIRRSALGELRFDPAFGRSGGEDHDFFLRFAANGHRMVVTNRARAYEEIPSERATTAYALRRAVRGGQIYAETRLRQGSRAAATAFTLDALLKVAIGAGLWLALRPFDRPRAFRYGKRVATNIGKLKGVIGSRPMAAWG
ncbi:glycosyltransferase family 2 protein [Pleomorphomonas sp. JP5]|uniref:glycosyltransferase family 2 protein n=1 Tax=Pleomorphomonas sp. JP5 TaxID=2942998 RepID=UPI002044144B|nr:glycosyltransferase [Pleomorphomonas sp. JP5]MCM5557843.1 glycosyltransferase [Pleomorphomonas sp. JP5]